MCSHLFTKGIDSRSFVKSLHDFIHLILSSLCQGVRDVFECTALPLARLPFCCKLFTAASP